MHVDVKIHSVLRVKNLMEMAMENICFNLINKNNFFTFLFEVGNVQSPGPQFVAGDYGKTGDY